MNSEKERLQEELEKDGTKLRSVELEPIDICKINLNYVYRFYKFIDDIQRIASRTGEEVQERVDRPRWTDFPAEQGQWSERENKMKYQEQQNTPKSILHKII